MKTINKLVSAIFLLAVVFVQAAPPVPGGGGGTGSRYRRGRPSCTNRYVCICTFSRSYCIHCILYQEV